MSLIATLGAIALCVFAVGARILAGSLEPDDEFDDESTTVEVALGGDQKGSHGSNSGQLVGIAAGGGGKEGGGGLVAGGGSGNGGDEGGGVSSGAASHGGKLDTDVSGAGVASSSQGSSSSDGVIVTDFAQSENTIPGDGKDASHNIRETTTCEHCGSINKGRADHCWSCGSSPGSTFEDRDIGAVDPDVVLSESDVVVDSPSNGGTQPSRSTPEDSQNTRQEEQLPNGFDDEEQRPSEITGKNIDTHSNAGDLDEAGSELSSRDGEKSTERTRKEMKGQSGLAGRLITGISGVKQSFVQRLEDITTVASLGAVVCAGMLNFVGGDMTPPAVGIAVFAFVLSIVLGSTAAGVFYTPGTLKDIAVGYPLLIAASIIPVAIVAPHEPTIMAVVSSITEIGTSAAQMGLNIGSTPSYAVLVEQSVGKSVLFAAVFSVVAGWTLGAVVHPFVVLLKGDTTSKNKSPQHGRLDHE
jgi:hypothetical protein